MIYVIILVLIILILIGAMYKVALKQREKELFVKEIHFGKKD